MISGYMKISTARVTVLFKKMKAKGPIEKERDPKENRRVKVTLSDQGREFATQVQERIDAHAAYLRDKIFQI